MTDSVTDNEEGKATAGYRRSAALDRLSVMDEEARKILGWALQKADPHRKWLWMFGNDDEDFFHEVLLYMFKHPPPDDISVMTAAVRASRWMIGRRRRDARTKSGLFHDGQLSLNREDGTMESASGTHGETGEVSMETKEVVEVAREMIRSVATKHQADVVLSLAEGLTLTDVATKLGMSRQRVYQIRDTVHRKLESAGKLGKMLEMLT